MILFFSSTICFLFFPNILCAFSLPNPILSSLLLLHQPGSHQKQNKSNACNQINFAESTEHNKKTTKSIWHQQQNTYTHTYYHHLHSIGHPTKQKRYNDDFDCSCFGEYVYQYVVIFLLSTQFYHCWINSVHWPHKNNQKNIVAPVPMNPISNYLLEQTTHSKIKSTATFNIQMNINQTN